MADHLIVLGDDGSEGADTAWRWITAHDWPGWDLDVVTATEVPEPLRFAPDQTPPTEGPSPFDRDPVPTARLGATRFLTTPGDPRAVLPHHDAASLLVVGAAGLGSLRAVVLGSTADWLIHQPATPVAVIRRSAPTRRVLCCVDGSSHAQRAVNSLASMPWIHDCEIHIVSIDDGRTHADAAIDAAAETFTDGGVTASSTVLTGRPTRAILSLIDQDDDPVDLVVCGTRGLTTFRQLWVGSTAAAVARHCGTSFLVATAGTQTG